MGGTLSVLIELVVVVLLALTVTYCIILDRRLQRLRADERAMRQTVVDLGMATERAERAIEGLRGSLAEGERSLGEKLRAADAVNADLIQTIRSGDEILARIGKAVTSARRAVDDVDAREAEIAAPTAAPPPAAPPPRSLSETLAAAQAFAEHARRRILPEAA